MNTSFGMEKVPSKKKQLSKLEVAGKVLYCCIQLGVLVTVLVLQFNDWPKEPDVYSTDDPRENSRGGESYTCGCSLPASLGLGADHDEGPKPNASVNICYDKSSLETVKILTYSNSAAARIERIFAEFEPDKKIYNLTVSGYNVTQEAYDLHGAIRDTTPEPAKDLQPLFIGGYKQHTMNTPLEDLLSTSFTSFPWSYVRLHFQYHCNSCALCGPDVVNNLSNGISNEDEWWASCFRWDSEQQEGSLSRQTCQGDESYDGKCLVYPTETLPPNFAISKFLEKFLDLPGVNRSLHVIPGGKKLQNTTRLVPSHLYLNVSQVQSSSIQLKYVEVVKNSALWVVLLDMFPTLDNECATMDRVRVCNGTSVCNMFTNTNKYDLRCLDMNVRDQCKQLMTANGTKSSTVDNTGRSNLWSRLNASSWLELECPEFKCENNVLPYFVMWNTSVEMEKDALNRFLSRRILDRSWAQRSGVCTTTYHDVYRFSRATPGADDNGTMFLETNCTSSDMSTSGYCWLTRRYHNITDNPTEDWKALDQDDHRFLKPHDHKLFICYRVKWERNRTWFINTFGILFSWIGTVDLIWRFLTKNNQISVWEEEG